METVLLGEDITLNISYVDGGVPYDPDTIQLDILRNAAQVVFGPYTYESEQVVRTAEGEYEVTVNMPLVMTPGVYSARWTAVVDDTPEYQYEDFQVIEPAPTPNEILDAPSRYGIIRESFMYSDLGMGTTDRLFLVGHAKGLPLNDPYQVINMQEAINILQADTDSPLLRGMLEAYNNGARDMWIVAAAPMTEYISNLTERTAARDEWGGLNFYERYSERLDTTYSMLLEWDFPEIIVPLEAPFYDSGDVDFLTQLADHCEAAFAHTGSARLGIIGTRKTEWVTADISVMAEDERLATYISSGKFVMVIVGEGTVILPQMPVGYTTSLATSVAAILAAQRFDVGVTYARLRSAASLVGRDLTKTEIATLTRARLNPVIRTQRGKRGFPFETVLATDNTLSPEGSDYWAIPQIRIICKTMNVIRALGRRNIGTIGYAQFQDDVKSYLASLVVGGYIKSFKLDIDRDTVERDKVYVDVAITPFIGVRELYFTVEVGPNR